MKTLLNLALILLLLTSCQTQPVKHDASELSQATYTAINKAFNTHDFTWDKSLAVRVQNLNKVPDQDNFVEGDNVIVKFMYLKEAVRIDKIAIYIDGNQAPLVALITPGGSFAKQSPYIVIGKADNACGGRYQAVAIARVGQKLIANKVYFRTTVADCDAANS